MRRGAALLLMALVATGCATIRRDTEAPVASRPDRSAPRKPTVQTGRASWYGAPHHGKKTASGEVYDKNRLTAAHRTLPLGTRVRVTNTDTGRSVVVRINDRGPFADGRTLDLSEAAAREIGPLGAGVFIVRLEILEDAAAD